MYWEQNKISLQQRDRPEERGRKGPATGKSGKGARPLSCIKQVQTTTSRELLSRIAPREGTPSGRKGPCTSNPQRGASRKTGAAPKSRFARESKPSLKGKMKKGNLVETGKGNL